MRDSQRIMCFSFVIGVAAFIAGWSGSSWYNYRPPLTWRDWGYVSCDFERNGTVTAIAGNIHIISGFNEDEFKDALIRLCQHKIRWRQT
jgi:hypothetical protein